MAVTMMVSNGVVSWAPVGSRRSSHAARSQRVYTDMRLWTEIRRRVLAEGLSRRQTCRDYGLHWHTLTRILEHSEPLGYWQAQPRPKRKLERFLPIMHEILKQDSRAPRKQRHTAKRIYDRLRAEHSYGGGYTIVKDALRAWRNQQAEVYMPLVHPPGEARSTSATPT